jgi:hypothetical protein
MGLRAMVVSGVIECWQVVGCLCRAADANTLIKPRQNIHTGPDQPAIPMEIG